MSAEELDRWYALLTEAILFADGWISICLAMEGATADPAEATRWRQSAQAWERARAAVRRGLEREINRAARG